MAGTEAPSFPPPDSTGWKSTVYPLGGGKTALAWRAMWSALADLPPGVWAGTDRLTEVGAKAAGCAQETARVLLTRAAAAGVLEREYRQEGGRRKVFYRQASHIYQSIVKALADGKYRTIAIPQAQADYLDELVRRGALSRRVYQGRPQYRLTWKPPAGKR